MAPRGSEAGLEACSYAYTVIQLAEAHLFRLGEEVESR